MLVDAPIPWFFMRTGFKPHFQTYRRKLRNIEILNRSGRDLDELILAELQLKDWLEIADSVQSALTDQVIDNAFKQMPDTVYILTAIPMAEKLRSRRDQLPKVAKEYYTALSRKANVVGTDKHELFQVEVLYANEVRVSVFKTNKNGKERGLLFDRTYYAHETDRINLYGLNGNDKFIITGSVKPKMKIFIWGGAGEDEYVVENKKSRVGKGIHINDSQYRNTFDVGKRTKVDIDDDLRAKEFDAEGWLLRYYLN